MAWPMLEEMISNEFAQRLLQTDRFRTDMANRALEDKLYAAIKASANDKRAHSERGGVQQTL